MNPDSPADTIRHPLKFSVITVTCNAAPLIGRTIRSVEEQDYPAVEHLIIDGNSADDTLALVHRYMERNSIARVKHEVNCLSEPDSGIYDAMNKGLQMCTGRYVLFLNAGDSLHTPDTLSRLAALVQTEAAQPAVIYGDTDIVDADGTFLRHRRLAPPADLTSADFRQGMLVCHQAFLARTDLAKETPYDMRYRFSSDYDWAIRVMKTAEARGQRMLYSGAVIADYLSQGATTRNHRRSLFERLRIMARHYGWGIALGEHLWFVLRIFVKK